MRDQRLTLLTCKHEGQMLQQVLLSTLVRRRISVHTRRPGASRCALSPAKSADAT
jgi:hypothetical protein